MASSRRRPEASDFETALIFPVLPYIAGLSTHRWFRGCPPLRLIYDEDYLTYLRAVVEKAGEHAQGVGRRGASHGGGGLLGTMG